MKAFRAYPAFTVVEVIVALAVVVILVVLLVPAVSSSRENGKRAVCSQHLHQVGVETTICAQANRLGTFPSLNMSLSPNPSGLINVLTTRRSDYAGGWNYYSPDSMLCPEEDRPGTVSIRNVDGTSRKMPVSFGYHVRMYYNGIGMNDGALGSPDEVVEFFDGSMSGNDSSTGKNIEGNYESTMEFSLYAITYRHRDRYAQAVFVDGHVKILDSNDSTWLPVFGGGNAPVAQLMGNSNGNGNGNSNGTTTTGSTNGNANGGGNGNANGHGSTTGSSTGASGTSTTTGSTTTGSSTGPSINNGHGNNLSGVDVSNPSRGIGGPNGGGDPSGNIDDERRGH